MSCKCLHCGICKDSWVYQDISQVTTNDIFSDCALLRSVGRSVLFAPYQVYEFNLMPIFLGCSSTVAG